ncbi:DUF6088 family protein [Tardiphaga sp. 803_E3_N1_3]|uniref:DUF6088 family protein n=1 Tax=Tardiphaga sp. 803_E3_N1_3 TaxID=3240785 RepID=UPI003F264E76
MTVVERVREALNTQKEGAVISAETLKKLGSRVALDQTLSRLAKTGETMRIARGLYVVPVRGKFGTYPPSPEKVVRAYARAKGKPVVPNGAVAANRLGLSTQQPIRQVYLTSGQAGKIKLGSTPVEVRHVPEWQTLLPNQLAGEAVRALAFMGKASAKETAVKLCRRLGPKEWAKLKRIRSKFPMWVKEAVLEAEHVV